LAVPITIGAAVPLLNWLQRRRELDVEDQRAQDEALQAYLDQLTQLLVRQRGQCLIRLQVEEEVGRVIKARTESLLRSVNAQRKWSIVLFLAVMELLETEDPTVSLEGADLRGVDGYGARLKGINLKGANIQEASLRRAHLEGARLEHADLQGADLQEAIFQEADLVQANLQGAALLDADFQGAFLDQANLEQANLRTANFHLAHLARAKSQRAHFVGTNLQGTDLRRAEFQWADFSGANRIGARFFEPPGAPISAKALRERILSGDCS
jgi:uncharacterized protein YjbI with pentapeptide repeats